MKTLPAQIVSMAMLLALPFMVSAQIFNGTLTLRTQAEVDAFHYTEITGNLIIGNPEEGVPSSNITSLAPLLTLTKVNTDFGGFGMLIVNNGHLHDLHGVENLNQPSSPLWISIKDNQALTSLQAFENYEILGDLSIINNDQLEDLEGLKNVKTLTEDLLIKDNQSLKSLHGLEKLNIIDNDFILTGNDQLKDIQVFESLLWVSNVYVTGSHLQNFKGLENILYVNNLSIINNQDLTSLQGLENIAEIGGNLVIVNNNQLNNLQGLENLIRMSDILYPDSLIIKNNQSLTSLKGLENLQSIQNLVISGNPNLNDCCAVAKIVSRVTSSSLISNGLTCNSIEDIQESCFLINYFTLVNANSGEDIFDMNPADSIVVINTSEVGDQLNISVNTESTMVGSVVFALNGKVVRTENVAPYTLAGDNPPGHYNNWAPLPGRYILKATPYEGENATGKQGVSLSVTLIVTDQPFVLTHLTLVNSTDNSDLYTLKDGSYIFLSRYENNIGLNIRANTIGNVGSIVFDLNEIKNYNTDNASPFALGGDHPAGNYDDVPEIKQEGFFKLTATPHAMPNGQGAAGTPLSITFKAIDFYFTDNYIIDFMLVDADANEDIMPIHDGSTIDLGQFATTSFNIRAVTQVDKISNGQIIFDYDGIQNFRIERVAPYALGGDTKGDYKPISLGTGQHTLKGTVLPSFDPEFYAKSISFTVVNNHDSAVRKINSIAASSKETVEGELPDNFSAALQKVSIYPNPTTGTLRIQIPDTERAVSLFLYNAQGNMVMKTSGDSEGSLTMNISHLAAGMYLLKITSAHTTETHRILLQ